MPIGNLTAVHLAKLFIRLLVGVHRFERFWGGSIPVVAHFFFFHPSGVPLHRMQVVISKIITSVSGSVSYECSSSYSAGLEVDAVVSRHYEMELRWPISRLRSKSHACLSSCKLNYIRIHQGHIR